MNKLLLISVFFVLSLYTLRENIQLQSFTIQKEWIDTGYFEWRTKENSADVWFEGMVALKITELGKQQEYLPKVTDGEQLNSAHKMFDGGKYLENSTKLKEAPFFNTCNIKDFSYMFENCFVLDSVPTYSTLNGENFHGMFYCCHNLRSAPEFNTFNGTDFGAMFFKTSIKSIPRLDTSNGIDFSSMFTSWQREAFLAEL